MKNVDFRVCTQDAIPYPSESFDLVVSHDVLEQVDHPGRSLAEIARVLKPGGEALNVCPTYDGAVSHHLDYVSRLPGPHWLVPLGVLVKAVNRLLRSGDFDTNPQPEPLSDWTGTRKVLPGLNGLTGSQLKALVRDFAQADITHRMLGQTRMPWLAAAFAGLGALSPAIKDRPTGSLVLRLAR